MYSCIVAIKVLIKAIKIQEEKFRENFQTIVTVKHVGYLKVRKMFLPQKMLKIGHDPFPDPLYTYHFFSK